VLQYLFIGAKLKRAFQDCDDRRRVAEN